MKQISMIKEYVLVILALVTFSCNSSNDEKKDDILSRLIVDFDTSIRDQEFNLDSLNNILSKVELQLTSLESKTFSNHLWATVATYKFNRDSTVVMIRSKKASARGFKNEVILHIGDSILFVNRFEVLTDDPNVGYELLETLDYVSRSKNILGVIRREFPRPLSDSTYLRKQEFHRYENVVGVHYNEELEYAQRIMNRN